MGGFLGAWSGGVGGILTGGPIGGLVAGIGGLLGGGGGMSPFNLASRSAALTQAISRSQPGAQLNTLVTTYHSLMGGPGMQSQMLMDMQRQNMQNLLFQQQINRQSQRVSTVANAQKAMHDAMMAMLNDLK